MATEVRRMLSVWKHTVDDAVVVCYGSPGWPDWCSASWRIWYFEAEA